jgi:hypothetical protein
VWQDIRIVVIKTGGLWRRMQKNGEQFWGRPGPTQGCGADVDDHEYISLLLTKFIQIVKIDILHVHCTVDTAVVHF